VNEAEPTKQRPSSTDSSSELCLSLPNATAQKCENECANANQQEDEEVLFMDPLVLSQSGSDSCGSELPADRKRLSLQSDPST